MRLLKNDAENLLVLVSMISLIIIVIWGLATSIGKFEAAFAPTTVAQESVRHSHVIWSEVVGPNHSLSKIQADGYCYLWFELGHDISIVEQNCDSKPVNAEKDR